MRDDIQKSLEIYKEQLNNGYIRAAYVTLTKYVAELKANFPKEYTTSSVAFGYLDYTYFYFTNDFLKNRNLKFAMVLNHKKLQVELWLAGRNIKAQEKYWHIMKDTSWNKGVERMPQYSILEVVLEPHIDFSDKEKMTHNIIERSVSIALEIEEYLKSVSS